MSDHDRDLDDLDDEEIELEPHEPEPVGLDALGQAVLLFEDWSLPFPPVPESLAPRMRILGRGLLGTRADAPGPYSLEWFLAELASDPADYLIFGHDGHGINSWAMHYYLVRGPLALFVQIDWGGAYTDDAIARAEILRAFRASEALVVAPRVAALAEGQRLLVVASDRALSRWGIVPRKPGEEALASLETRPDALAAALAWAQATSSAADPAADLRPSDPIWA
jgi:hypothetical protein